jgi:organic radical activating enzyme
MEKTYRVSEIFRSVQGEGPEAGMDAVFVRFAGCNLRCEFCDEPSRMSGHDLTAEQIVEEVAQAAEFDGTGTFGPERVILTGGEPLLQVDHRLLTILERDIEDVMFSIETNGSLAIDANPDLIDVVDRALTIVISPKGPPDTLSRLLFKETDYVLSLKVLVPLPGGLTFKDLVKLSKRASRQQCYLQPTTPRNWKQPEGRAIFLANVAEAVKLQRGLALHRNEEPNSAHWRVMPQAHVWMEVR